MLNVYMLPTPNEAQNDTTNSINQIVLRLAKLLPAYGVQLVERVEDADLVAAHAGQANPAYPCDVAHLSGLYPTAHHGNYRWHWAANVRVIENIRQAIVTTVPSEWVADMLRRDMHIDPAVIGWGVDVDEWTPSENQGYVLWNKTRADSVCDPTPLIELAKRFPQTQFVTTFADNPPPNVKVIGKLPYEAMREYVRHAGVYLATTKETFGIGTLEAMASGVPVLGFDWGGTAHLVASGTTGFLCTPADYDALADGLRYIFQHREVLSQNAHQVAQAYGWDRVANCTAETYKRAFAAKQRLQSGVKVSVVIPCYNYGRYLADAIKSVKAQETTFEFEIVVVDDRSTDNSVEIAHEALGEFDTDGVSINFTNVGPAATRNSGINSAKGQYIVCLDADDKLGSPNFLQTLADALDADRTLGIAFTGLQMMDKDGNLGDVSGWPKGFSFEAQMQRHNQVPTCCMFRREAWNRAGGYRAAFEPAEDAELWLRIGALGYRAKQVTTEGWFQYRLHSDSLSSSVRTGAKREPDWTEYHPWVNTPHKPFAAIGIASNGSWPVRNYDRPDVSVIIPVGPGHEANVRAALDSVEAQTTPLWECILINDTGKKLDLWGYPWVKVIDSSRPGAGAGAARNLGVKASKAPFVAFLDADDLLKPAFLEKALKAYRAHGRYAYTDWYSVNKDGVLEHHAVPEYEPGIVFQKVCIHAVTTLVPRTWFDAIGGFDEKMPAWEDVDFYMKLAAAGHCGVRVPEALFTYDYRTGQRRESGEAVKADLKAFLAQRYSEYVMGIKMCACNEPPPSRSAARSAGGDSSGAAAGEMVLVRYVWNRAGIAAHSVAGPTTRQSYGMRAKGDMFYIWQEDLDVNMFELAQKHEPPAAAVTALPPPPQLLQAIA